MLIAQIPTEVVEASSNLLQYGAIGACLVLAIIGIVFLIRYLLNGYKERILRLEKENDEKEKEIKRLNEVRTESAIKIVELVGVVTEKMKDQTEVIEKMHGRLGRILRKMKSDTGSSDDDADF